MNISNDERLNLKKLISESECEDNTEYIRRIKHSRLIQKDINTMIEFKKSHEGFTIEQIEEECRNKCIFLFTNYTDIFNKLIKNELNLELMGNLIEVLKLIEEEDVDQHEASVLVGKLLKKIYIDSAITRCENLDKSRESEKPVINQGKPLSWNDYKKQKQVS
jgi:hypothetical protein